ncbi:hypothetical protein LTR62_006868 [Meristemomyces frigidus]|uniref:Pentacotripeptide-repeat region of PRORP domain-containing protein n=1 Tax=Meristemomyces frigidus TaxID=1508187 RepID=A0AAN7TDN2_9PEZI|nr:hypothetical protein LTR62_006868 [Meristemomyces frigidus]
MAHPVTQPFLARLESRFNDLRSLSANKITPQETAKRLAAITESGLAEYEPDPNQYSPYATTILSDDWDAIHLYAWDRPEDQDMLVEVLICMSRLPRPSGAASEAIKGSDFMLWSGLTGVRWASRESWEAPTRMRNAPPWETTDRPQSIAHFVNINAFLARLQATNLPALDASLMGLWTLREALEHPGVRQSRHEPPDFFLPAAAVWIDVVGAQIYEWDYEFAHGGNRGRPGLGGPLWEGDRAVTNTDSHRGMLERTTACLKSGAQHTLRCVNTPHRTKRQLHSTFWQHGAGDLELLPWAPPSIPARQFVVATKHDDIHQNQRARTAAPEKSRQALWARPADGVFLDFLYPPQALALLRSTTSNTVETRHGKRLSEGHIQTTRGYTSDSRGGAAGPKSKVRRVMPDAPGGAEGTRLEDATPAYRERRAQHVLGELGSRASKTPLTMPGPASKQENKVEFFPFSEFSGDSTRFASSAADLAEAEEEVAAMQSPLQRLRQILATTRAVDCTESGEPPQSIIWVLKLYDELDNASKQDLRLTCELLSWLSKQRNAEADIRCATLYHAIPLTSRTSYVYRSALSAFLRRGLHIQAVQLHKEALQNILNADQVTKTFFDYAVGESRWQLAMNVFAQYRLQNSKREQGVGMFWLHVSETPGLLRKALALAKHFQTLHRAGTVSSRTRSFTARFYAEALLQEFGNDKNPSPVFAANNPPKGNVGRLFEYLRVLEDETPVLYNRILVALLQPGRKGPYVYPHIHRLVSYIYTALCSSDSQIPEWTLELLLNQLIHYWDNQQRHGELHHSITVSTVLKDWQKHHGIVRQDAVQRVLRWHASRGRLDLFSEWLDYYGKHFTSYENQRDVSTSTIYIHARRADLSEAKRAFARVMSLTAEHKELPPLSCWNVLIHAHARVDDVEGGLDLLKEMVERGLLPDQYSFHPVMEMLAKRGDVEGVRDLIAQFDRMQQQQRSTAFIVSLLLAYVNRGEVEQAEKELRKAIPEVKTAEIRGSVTKSFNVLLTAHALQRDINATMRVFRWMKAEQIRMDANTFAALIQALALHRMTAAAYKILTSVMRAHQVQPTAFHYALVMTGYVNQRMASDALSVYKDMQDHNIKPTFSTNTIYLKARALDEQRIRRGVGPKKTNMPLKSTMAHLQRLLSNSLGNDLAAHQPGLSHGDAQADPKTPAAYFAFLIYIHGRRRCYGAVKELFEQYQTTANANEQDDIPIQLLAALMSAHLQAREFDDVERCWLLAQEQANKRAATVHVPRLSSPEKEQQALPDLMQLLPSNSADAREAGFSTVDAVQRQIITSHGAEEATAPRQQSLTTTALSRAFRARPSRGRQHILTRPLRYYLYALHNQGRIADSLSTVAKLVGRGYTLDNRTWNAFIQLLCQSSPPLVLLALTLTERLLIPSFPGWINTFSKTKPHPPNRSARVEGLEYIRARYLAPGQLMPQYATLVHLASAVLRLRRLEAMGRQGTLDRENWKGLEKYVGTLKEVREQAPRTMLAVQSMPMIDDKLQQKLLKRYT